MFVLVLELGFNRELGSVGLGSMILFGFRLELWLSLVESNWRSTWTWLDRPRSDNTEVKYCCIVWGNIRIDFLCLLLWIICFLRSMMWKQNSVTWSFAKLFYDWEDGIILAAWMTWLCWISRGFGFQLLKFQHNCWNSITSGILIYLLVHHFAGEVWWHTSSSFKNSKMIFHPLKLSTGTCIRDTRYHFKELVCDKHCWPCHLTCIGLEYLPILLVV